MDWLTFGAIVAVVVAISGPLSLSVKNANAKADEARNKLEGEARLATERFGKSEYQRGFNDATQIHNDGRLKKLEKKTK